MANLCAAPCAMCCVLSRKKVLCSSIMSMSHHWSLNSVPQSHVSCIVHLDVCAFESNIEPWDSDRLICAHSIPSSERLTFSRLVVIKIRPRVREQTRSSAADMFTQLCNCNCLQAVKAPSCVLLAYTVYRLYINKNRAKEMVIYNACKYSAFLDPSSGQNWVKASTRVYTPYVRGSLPCRCQLEQHMTPLAV